MNPDILIIIRGIGIALILAGLTGIAMGPSEYGASPVLFLLGFLALFFSRSA